MGGSLNALTCYWRGEAGYDEARERITWNHRLQRSRSPAGIVAVRSAQEVAQALAFARERGLQVTMRGSGHSYIASFLRDDVLLLDTGAIDHVAIDGDSKLARVGPGVRGGELIKSLAAQGFAFPIGHCADVAMGGYLLSGGIGWNYAEWGPASHNLISVELVTAAGEKLRVSAEDHAELFWAAKGAGAGFFAVVTGYELALQPLPPVAWLWSATFALESSSSLAPWLTAATRQAHPGVEVMALVGTDPDSGRRSVTVRAVATGAQEGELRAQVASFGSPPADAELLGGVREEAMEFAQLPKLSAMPGGKRVAADQVWTESTLGEMLLAVAPLAHLPGKLSTVNLVAPAGDGSIPYMPHGEEGAFSVGGGPGAGIYAMWDDPAQDALHCDWVRKVDDALAPLRSGRYVGESDLTAGPGRIEQCFTPDALARIEALRKRYDESGLFVGFPK